MVLDIEQDLIITQAPTAIVSKDSEIISCGEYLRKMMEEKQNT